MNFNINDIFEHKLNTTTRSYPYDHTPHLLEYWNGTLQEAQGHGISISSFGDTSDKIVLHPGHLGYIYNYYWGDGYWGDTSCWNLTSEDIIYKANQELYNLGLNLNKTYTVWLFHPSGSSQGHLHSFYYDFHKLPNSYDEFIQSRYYCDDFVLFIFGLNLDTIEDMLNV